MCCLRACACGFELLPSVLRPTAQCQGGMHVLLGRPLIRSPRLHNPWYHGRHEEILHLETDLPPCPPDPLCCCALKGGVLVGVAIIAGGGFEPRRPPVYKDIVFVVPSSSRSCWLSTRSEDTLSARVACCVKSTGDPMGMELQGAAGGRQAGS
jgi:hypothetical protein